MPVILLLLLIVLFTGPGLWVRYVMKRHGQPIPDMPGAGGELAEHLIERFGLEGVRVTEAPQGVNAFDYNQRQVLLSPDIYHGKSLTAVAVAAHEVGHAIQHARQEPLVRWHIRLWPLATTLQQVARWMILALPLILLLFRAPQLMLPAALLFVGALVTSALLKAVLLPLEWDASFNKALPILREGYIPDHAVPAVRQVLRAAALTYATSTLFDILLIWRLIRR